MSDLRYRDYHLENISCRTVDEFCSKVREWVESVLPEGATNISIDLASKDYYDSPQGIIELSCLSPETSEEREYREKSKAAALQRERAHYLELKRKFEGAN